MVLKIIKIIVFNSTLPVHLFLILSDSTTLAEKREEKMLRNINILPSYPIFSM